MNQSTRECVVPDCAKVVVAKQMCNTHYARHRRNGTLEYVREPFDRSADNSAAKKCSSCLAVLGRTSFYQSARNKDGLRGTCKRCDNSANQARYKSNPEPVLALQRKRYATTEYQERRAEYMEKYYAENFALYAQRSAERRARQRAAMVDKGITVKSLRARHGDNCVFCGRTMEFARQTHGRISPLTATIEHMTPLARGGLHSWGNVRLSCWADNSAKNQKTAEEYLNYLSAIAANSQ